MKKIKVISFDADDTLWVNEPFFREAEEEFSALLALYADEEKVTKELYKTEIANVPLYGYGIKGFTLSMIETALKISENKLDPEVVGKIIQLGQNMLDMPVDLIEGVEETLDSLYGNGNYQLIVATKGDLADQTRKMEKSGLSRYFRKVQVMSHKTEAEYTELMKTLRVSPDEFLMIGNSLKSDILPVLNLGGKGIHVPFEITWAHEQVDEEVIHNGLFTVNSIREVLKILP